MSDIECCNDSVRGGEMAADKKKTNRSRIAYLLGNWGVGTGGVFGRCSVSRQRRRGKKK